MLYRYQPANCLEMIPVLGLMHPGDVADIDAAQVALALENTAGADGGPCLVPVADSIAPAATPPAASDTGALDAPTAGPVSVAGSATLSAGKPSTRRRA